MFKTPIIALIGAFSVFCLMSGNPYATSLADAVPEVQGPEVGFSSQFSRFYAYDDDPRGMMPIRIVGDDGQAISTIPAVGEVILLHFWATWCPPCIGELPLLAGLAADYGGRADFRIVPVSLDYGVEHGQIADFLRRNDAAALPVLTVPTDDPAWGELTGFTLPVSFLIGPGGRVLYKMVGDADWGGDAARGFLDDLLKNQQK